MFLISTDSVGGEVPWTGLQSWQAIGSFTNSTAISFEPAAGGSKSQISVRFVAEMPFEVNDTVTIGLPRFTGSNFERLADTNTGLIECVQTGMQGLFKKVSFIGPQSWTETFAVVETQNVTEARNVTTLQNVTTEVVCPSNSSVEYNETVRKNVTREVNVTYIRYNQSQQSVNGRVINVTCAYEDVQLENKRQRRT